VTEDEEAEEGEEDGARSGGRKAMKDCPVLLSRPPLLSCRVPGQSTKAAISSTTRIQRTEQR
jgi:hypothetical protein